MMDAFDVFLRFLSDDDVAIQPFRGDGEWIFTFGFQDRSIRHEILYHDNGVWKIGRHNGPWDPEKFDYNAHAASPDYELCIRHLILELGNSERFTNAWDRFPIPGRHEPPTPAPGYRLHANNDGTHSLYRTDGTLVDIKLPVKELARLSHVLDCALEDLVSSTIDMWARPLYPTIEEHGFPPDGPSTISQTYPRTTAPQHFTPEQNHDFLNHLITTARTHGLTITTTHNNTFITFALPDDKYPYYYHEYNGVYYLGRITGTLPSTPRPIPIESHILVFASGDYETTLRVLAYRLASLIRVKENLPLWDCSTVTPPTAFTPFRPYKPLFSGRSYVSSWMLKTPNGHTLDLYMSPRLWIETSSFDFFAIINLLIPHSPHTILTTLLNPTSTPNDLITDTL